MSAFEVAGGYLIHVVKMLMSGALEECNLKHFPSSRSRTIPGLCLETVNLPDSQN